MAEQGVFGDAGNMWDMQARTGASIHTQTLLRSSSLETIV